MHPEGSRDPTTIPALVASKDIKTVTDTLQWRWDMYCGEDFVAALIAFVDATQSRIAELEVELERVIRHGLIRHMWQIENPSDTAQVCPECGKLMALYLEEDRLTPAVWRCECGYRQFETDPQLYEQLLEKRLAPTVEDEEAMLNGPRIQET